MIIKGKDRRIDVPRHHNRTNAHTGKRLYCLIASTTVITEISTYQALTFMDVRAIKVKKYLKNNLISSPSTSQVFIY